MQTTFIILFIFPLIILLTVILFIVLKWGKIKRAFKLLNCTCQGRGCPNCLIDEDSKNK